MIRETAPDDLAQVLALYPRAFPDEDLQPLVSDLLAEQPTVLSLAGFDGAALVAHAVFTACGTKGCERAASLLGPLGVVPERHRQGWGSALVRDGLKRLQAMGVGQVFVLGNPAYYGRFGFAPERRVLAPYPLPDKWTDAWQSLTLASGAPLTAGRLSLPPPWMKPALWGA